MYYPLVVVLSFNVTIWSYIYISYHDDSILPTVSTFVLHKQFLLWQIECSEINKKNNFQDSSYRWDYLKSSRAVQGSKIEHNWNIAFC